MTDEIFRRDGYVFEFEANVVSIDGDLVELDSTAFYPGGGGQVCDTGTLSEHKAIETIYKGKKIFHNTPGHNLKVGSRIWCSVDWDRRYDLMVGHTGEHLLFCSLKKQCPDLNIVSIFISPEDKYVIVDQDISWEDIGKALNFANEAIRDNLTVSRSLMDRDDPELENVRIKIERIDEDEEISVVSIGDLDLSACEGLHIMETSEIEMLFVDKKVSAGSKGFSIHFKVGNAAKNSALMLANICLQTVEEVGSKSEDIIKTVRNMKHDIDLGKTAMKELVKQKLSTLSPEKIKGIDVFKELFISADKNTLIEYAEKTKEKGNIAVFLSVGDTVSIILSSGTPALNCKTALSELLVNFGGRSGGSPDFSQGGIPNVDDAEKLMESIIAYLEHTL